MSFVRIRYALLTGGLLALAAGFAFGAPAGADDAEAEPPIQPPSFERIEDDSGLLIPCSGPDDWIRTTSSEWLHGTIREFKVKSLDFKSVRLKELTLKWKYIAELCTAYPMRFVTNDMTVHTGPGRLHEKTVYVWTQDGLVEIERGRLFAILRGEPTELNRWTLKASLGLDANTGNTDQVSFNTAIDVKRRSSTSLLAGRYQVSLGSANNIENSNRQEGEVWSQRDFTRKFYIKPFDVSFLSDVFQNIAFRTTPGAGGGYRLFDTPNFETEIDLEVIYQYTRFNSVTAGVPLTTNDAGNRLSARVRWDITGDLEFIGDHATTLVYTDFGLTTYNTRLGLIYDLTDLLKLELRVNHNRLREPNPDENGDVPKQDDLQTIVALSINLRP